MINRKFYFATIAYHVGLNAILGGHRTPANDLEKFAKTLPRFSTTVLVLGDERPTGAQAKRPFSYAPLSPYLRDMFEKLEQDLP